MAQNTLLQTAIAAARAGRELTARDMFLRIVKAEPQNEVAWMWLTGLLDDLDERIQACERVVEINPGNQRACLYLDQLRLEKQKIIDEENRRMEGCIQQVREWMRANKRDEALRLSRDLIRDGVTDARVWRMLAELTPDQEEKVRALENLLAHEPGDMQAKQQLDTLRHFQNDPLDMAEVYEENGEIEKAIATYKVAAATAKSTREFDKIYWKIIRLENMQQEKIAHVSPTLSVARLTGGPAILYFSLVISQTGVHVLRLPLLWLGLPWVLLGGFMVAVASVRSHHRLWFVLFKDVGSGGSPSARRAMSAAGWVLILLPHLILFAVAYNQLIHFLMGDL